MGFPRDSHGHLYTLVLQTRIFLLVVSLVISSTRATDCRKRLSEMTEPIMHSMIKVAVLGQRKLTATVVADGFVRS